MFYLHQAAFTASSTHTGHSAEEFLAYSLAAIAAIVFLLITASIKGCGTSVIFVEVFMPVSGMTNELRPFLGTVGMVVEGGVTPDGPHATAYRVYEV